MNKYENTEKDIHNRIYKFILRVFIIIKMIPRAPENNRIIDQLSGSLTSMGANDQEAEVAGSKKDFILKYAIVRKETKETYYWLCLIKDLNLLSKDISDDIGECRQILQIVSAIVLKSKINERISS